MADGGIGEAALATEVMGAGETAAAATALTPELMSATGALGTVGGLGGLGGLSTVGAGSTLAGSGLAGLASAAPEAAAQITAAQQAAAVGANQIAAAAPTISGASQLAAAGAPAFEISPAEMQASEGIVSSGAPAAEETAQDAIRRQIMNNPTAVSDLGVGPGGAAGSGVIPAGASGAAAPGGLGDAWNAIKNMGSQVGEWWDKKSTPEKFLYGGAGLLGANALLGPKAGGVPAQQSYSGPLSRFQYDPSKFKATAPIQPTPYQPVYQNYQNYADGGMLDAGANPGMMMQGQNDPLAFQSTGVERMASGGAPQGAYQIPNHMSAIDSYVAQANSGDMATVMAKAKSGDQNAMIALNRLQSTPNQNYSGGGISSLGSYSDGGRMLKGPGDGMSDDIPATIANKQPARLANDEFVVPADVVSHLGNGSSDAGAKQLYKMMDRVRQARTGNKAQGKEINPDKYLPT